MLRLDADDIRWDDLGVLHTIGDIDSHLKELIPLVCFPVLQKNLYILVFFYSTLYPYVIISFSDCLNMPFLRKVIFSIIG